MKKKGKNVTVDLQIYPRSVMFSFGQSDAELREAMKSFADEDAIEKYFKLEYSAGRSSLFNNGYILIRIRTFSQSSAWYGLLQHEIFHAVFQIGEWFGFEHSKKSEEAFAYLVSYLTEEIYKRI